MGFNWVTFFAQIINLFVLAWLMKRFLYGPIVAVIAKRQAYIEDKVKNAEKAERAAQKQQDLLTRQAEQWQSDRQKRLNAVYAETETLRHEQAERLRLEAEALRQKMQDDLNREAVSKELELRNMVVQNFMALSEKVLSDLSGMAPMTQCIALFRKKTEGLSKKTLTDLRQTVARTGTVTVNISQKPDAATEKELSRFLQGMLGADKVRYVITPELILGIEVIIGETVLEWHLKSYLDMFENHLNTAVAGLIVKE